MHQLLLPAALLSLVLFPFAAPQDPAKPSPPDLTPGKVDPALMQRMTWLSGTWILEDGGTTTEEHWRPLQGTTMLGTSHSFDAKQTRFFEFLRITATKGGIAYIAMPRGTKATPFLLTKLEDGAMEFENAEHDHPQRIRYERTEKGVTATIGQLDGSRQQQFVFRRKE